MKKRGNRRKKRGNRRKKREKCGRMKKWEVHGERAGGDG